MVAVAPAAVVVPSAGAHQTVNGVWTYRYFTRDNSGSAWSNCQNNQGHVDPLNIITYQWGEWSRMNGHFDNETHWGPTDLGGGR